MDIRPYFLTVGPVTRYEALSFLITGEISEATLMRSLSKKEQGLYAELSDDDKLSYRRHFTSLKVADGDAVNGKWEPKWASDVTIYPTPASIYRPESTIEIGTAGTNRGPAETKAYAAVITLAADLAEMALEAIEAGKVAE